MAAINNVVISRSASEFLFSPRFSGDFDVQSDFYVRKQAGHWGYQAEIF